MTCTREDQVMRKAVKAALAILAASAIMWAVEPVRAEVQDSGLQRITHRASEAASMRRP